jgi:hypothetical protein
VTRIARNGATDLAGTSQNEHLTCHLLTLRRSDSTRCALGLTKASGNGIGLCQLPQRVMDRHCGDVRSTTGVPQITDELLHRAS